MKKLTYILTGFIIFMVSCTDNWEEHYGLESAEDASSVVSPLNLLEYLKTQPQYSGFVEALEKTNVAEQLTRDQFLTVWAVNNQAMEELSAIGLPDTTIVKYHVNNLSFSVNKLKPGQRLRSLSGKYIPVQQGGGSGLRVGSRNIIIGNQFTRNGVVHEINRLMVPDKSIAEYLNTLDDEYSIIRDSIFALNDTLFDPVNSIPKGVDLTGNTIYDSVFIINNPLFENADIASEFSQVTLFLPGNAVIEGAYRNLKSQYDQFGKAMTYADTMIAFNWIREAILFNRVIENYGSELDLESVMGRVWRTSVQKVNTQPRTMSNGLIYEVTKLKIPNNVHISKIKSLFQYYSFVPENLKPQLFTFKDTTDIQVKTTDTYTFPTLNISGNYTILQLRGNLENDKPLSVDFTPVKLERLPNGTTTATPILVPPGEYNLYMGVQSKNHPYINVYVNDELVAAELNVDPSSPWNYDRVNQTVPGTKYDGIGGLVGIINIPGDEMTTFRIKVEFARLGKGSAEELKLYHWALLPTENNY